VGQSEVFNYLRQQRLSGNHKFFSAIEVHNVLRLVEGNPQVRYNTNRLLNQLANYGFLEIKMTGKVYDWRRLFRIKEEYL